jgi:hypothetical protein
VTASTLLAILLAVAVLLGWARLLLWQRAAPVGGRSRGWRLAVLLALQLVAAALLYLTLMPPPVAGGSGRLVVATAGTPAAELLARGERVVLLPEAQGALGGTRAPDLATALRQNPGTRRLLVLGSGLSPRDREAARGLAIDFTPMAPPTGLVALAPPPPVAPGAAFRVGGEAAGLGGGWAELLDPAGTRIARQRIDATGRFDLAGTARAAGLALFTVRLRDAAGVVVEDVPVPLRIEAQGGPRVILLAGAPGPEPKFLRRWATDAGVAMRARMSAGGGIQLGDAPVALALATLAATDLVVVDERAWALLGGGERAAIVGAVRGGMGLMLRPTGPLPGAVAAQWRRLGFAIAGGGAGEAAVRLASGEALHALPLRVAAPDAVPFLRDARGAVVGRWRAVGRGRVGLWTLTDSFTLALAGDAGRYGELWSDAFAVLARPGSAADMRIEQPAWVQQRLVICGVGAGVTVVDLAGGETRPVVDPATGPAACAGFWPTRAGWHRLRAAGPDGKPREQLFLVRPADALPAMRATMARDATLRLTGIPADGATGVAALPARGSPWPWFAGWLVAAALLWWLERARFGRRIASA